MKYGLTDEIFFSSVSISGRTGTLISYAWVNIPLVYTQIVTLSVHIYFMVALLGKEEPKTTSPLSVYVQADSTSPPHVMWELLGTTSRWSLARPARSTWWVGTTPSSTSTSLSSRCSSLYSTSDGFRCLISAVDSKILYIVTRFSWIAYFDVFCHYPSKLQAMSTWLEDLYLSSVL